MGEMEWKVDGRFGGREDRNWSRGENNSVALVSFGFIHIPDISAEFQLQWHCIKSKDVF